MSKFLQLDGLFLNKLSKVKLFQLPVKLVKLISWLENVPTRWWDVVPAYYVVFALHAYDIPNFCSPPISIIKLLEPSFEIRVCSFLSELRAFLNINILHT